MGVQGDEPELAEATGGDGDGGGDEDGKPEIGGRGPEVGGRNDPRVAGAGVHGSPCSFEREWNDRNGWEARLAERLNVRNGICLNRLHDAAFDQHLISFDGDLRLVLSTRLKSAVPHEAVSDQFEAFEGKVLSIPEDGTAPDPAFLERHRKKLAN